MPEEAVGLTTVGGRVRWLLANIWGGNRSRMAEFLGMSHTVVNKVAGGGREPGKRFLTALLRDTRIDPLWLLQGVGRPWKDVQGPQDPSPESLKEVKASLKETQRMLKAVLKCLGVEWDAPDQLAAVGARTEVAAKAHGGP